MQNAVFKVVILQQKKLPPKSNNLITGFATLNSNNCHKVLAATGIESFRSNFGLLFFAELF